MSELDARTLQILLERGVINNTDVDKLKENSNASEKYTISEILNNYLFYLRDNFTSNTIHAYVKNVRQFIQIYFDDDYNYIKKSVRLPKIEKTDIIKFFYTLKSNGYSESSIRNYKYSLTNFLEYVSREYSLEVPNLDGLSLPTSDRVNTDALTDSEIRGISKCTNTLRNELIILFLYETGMRRGELIDCKKNDININECYVNVRYKTDNTIDRVAYYTKDTGRLIEEYIESWEKEIDKINSKRCARAKKEGKQCKVIKDSEYLFQTARSDKISYAVVYKALKEACYEYYLSKLVKGGVDENEAKVLAKDRADGINTETLRNSRRAFYYAQGKNTEDVQLLMGDSNYWVTKRYLKVAQELYPNSFK